MKGNTNYSKTSEPFFLTESERERGPSMSKMIRKIEVFDAEFKKPEFSRNTRNHEILEASYSNEEEDENSFINTDEAKSQNFLNAYENPLS